VLDHSISSICLTQDIMVCIPVILGISRLRFVALSEALSLLELQASARGMVLRVFSHSASLRIQIVHVVAPSKKSCQVVIHREDEQASSISLFSLQRLHDRMICSCFHPRSQIALLDLLFLAATLWPIQADQSRHESQHSCASPFPRLSLCRHMI
jgi:hypothetical protein